MRLEFLFSILACVVLSVDVLKLSDKAKGMNILGAFADSLGAPTEDANSAHECHFSPPSERSCSLIVADTWYNSSMYPNIWKIWPPPEYIENMKGIFTDDTSLRLALWNPFLSQLNSSSIEGDDLLLDLESKYKIWSIEMQKELYNEELKDPKDWYDLNRRQMIADNLCMMDIAGVYPPNACDPKHGSNPFYLKNEPTAFGLYMYLETSFGFGIINSLCQKYTNFEIFEYFTNFTKLDEDYGHEVTGISGTILSNAVISEDFADSNLGFGVWLRQNIFLWVEELQKRAEEKSLFEQVKVLTRFKNEFEDMYQLSDSIRGESVEVFLETYCHGVYDNSSRTPQDGMKPHDPLTMLKLILFAVNFATDYSTNETDVFLCHELVMSSPADTDTVGNFMGMFMGSYYGYEALKDMECRSSFNSKVWGNFLDVERFMVEFYRYDTLLQPFEVYYSIAKKTCSSSSINTTSN